MNLKYAISGFSINEALEFDVLLDGRFKDLFAVIIYC